MTPNKDNIINSKLLLDAHKLSWHSQRVRDWLDGKHVAPITIDMALTQDCNYRCKYCYAEFQRNDGYRMKRETILQFLKDCAEIGVKAISFTGDGESSLSPHFEEAVITGKKLGLDISTSTHGERLNHLNLLKILESLTYIRVNISAGTPNRYARVHGVGEDSFHKVIDNIKQMVALKKEHRLSVTIGLQMVLMPENGEDIIPLAQLACSLEVDYLVIKHCSDNKDRSLKIDYSKYFELKDTIEQAEKLTNPKTQITAKISKIFSGGKRNYTKCFGPSLMLQISGTGLVAPCGDLFDQSKEKFHIGNIYEKSFKEIWNSERYKEIMSFIGSDQFNPQKECGTLCLQHYVNNYLFEIKEKSGTLQESELETPPHVNFI